MAADTIYIPVPADPKVVPKVVSAVKIAAIEKGSLSRDKLVDLEQVVSKVVGLAIGVQSKLDEDSIVNIAVSLGDKSVALSVADPEDSLASVESGPEGFVTNPLLDGLGEPLQGYVSNDLSYGTDQAGEVAAINLP